MTKQLFYKSFGSIEGIFKVTNTDGQPIFTIQDILTNQSVICNFIFFLNNIDELVDKRVSVYGLIRENFNGEIISIKGHEIELFSDDDDSFPSVEDICGILPQS